MILLTGGSGLLGRYLAPMLNNVLVPSKSEFNIIRPKLPDGIELIVHCAAYTDVNGAESNKEECYKLNVTGTKQLSKLSVPIIYISTDSVFDGEKGNYSEADIPNPQNFYSLTKLLGEMCLPKGIGHVIRTSFKPWPWNNEFAFEDQYSSADNVSEIATMIAKLINSIPQIYLPEIIHIGTERKSSYELAKRSKPDVKPIKLGSVEIKRPRDTSFDLSLWKSLDA